MSALKTQKKSSTEQNSFKPEVFALGAVGAVLTSYTAIKLYKWVRKATCNVPGKNDPGYPYFGELYALRSEGIRDFVQRKYDRHGEISQAYLMGESLVFLCSKEGIEWFEMQERKGNIRKPNDLVLGSQGILNQSGEAHKRSRAMFLKSIGPGNLRSIFPMIESCVRECFGECVEKGEFDNYLHQAKSLAWNIGTTLLFGDLISKAESEEILHSCHEMISQLQSAIIRYPLPGTNWKRSKDARRRMATIFERVLRSRIHEFDVSSGLFVDRLLHEHVNKHGTTEMSSHQMEYMVDQVLVFVLGSHETTASTLTNVMTVMHEMPEYRVRFRELYDEWEGNVDYDKIKENSFISSFLTECMRFKSISGISTRFVVNDVQYKQYTIPAGTKIIPGLSVIHHTMGDSFDASRVKDVGNEKSNERTFFGFGIGAHACAGQKLAYLELAVTLLVMCGVTDWEITNTPECGKHGIMHHIFACSFQPRG